MRGRLDSLGEENDCEALANLCLLLFVRERKIFPRKSLLALLTVSTWTGTEPRLEFKGGKSINKKKKKIETLNKYSFYKPSIIYGQFEIIMLLYGQ